MYSATLALLLAGFQIDHPPVDCVVRDRMAVIESIIQPAEEVQEARVYFRLKDDAPRFFVVMEKKKLGRFVGHLPKPHAKGTVTYYLMARFRAGETTKTPVQTAEIVTEASKCDGEAADTANGPDVEVGCEEDCKKKPEGFAGIARVRQVAAETAVVKERSEPPRASSARTAAPGPAAAAFPGEYLIGPEDILKITVFDHVDLTQSVVVQTDGSFTFPLLERVKAGGLTPKGLEKSITEQLAKRFIRNPQVTVVVQEYRSRMVSVVGEVSRPGNYPLTGSDTVVELLSKAGPLTQNAASDVLVIRPPAGSGPVLPTDTALTADGPALGGSQAEVITVSLRDIQLGRLEKNLLLQPNDTLFVPQSARVFVSGEVRSPGAYPFTSGTTVRQAISLAGGLTNRGTTSRVRVVRQIDGKARERKIALDDPVEPGDTVVVKERIF